MFVVVKAALTRGYCQGNLDTMDSATKNDTGRALQIGPALSGLALLLAAAAVLAGPGDAGTAPVALLIVALLVLAMLEGVLVAGLRSEAERGRRAVERS